MKYFEINLDNYHKILVAYIIEDETYHYSVFLGRGEEVLKWEYYYGSFDPQGDEECKYKDEKDFIESFSEEMKYLFDIGNIHFDNPSTFIAKEEDSDKIVLIQSFSRFDAMRIASLKLNVPYNKLRIINIDEAIECNIDGYIVV